MTERGHEASALPLAMPAIGRNLLAQAAPRAAVPPPSVRAEPLLTDAVLTSRAWPLPPLAVRVHTARLADETPWVRSWGGSLNLAVQTTGWPFPTPLEVRPPPASETAPAAQESVRASSPAASLTPKVSRRTRLAPSPDAVLLRERLLMLLQPPLEHLFTGKRITLPFEPFRYQLEGIAFLMPRHSALLADEMGLGKTMQTIVALRLLLHAGLVRSCLIVCPKPLVPNWGRELRAWGEDIPFEVIAGSTAHRRFLWTRAPSPVKLVNYEVLTRDQALLADPAAGVAFDLVILDEAQRIKNHGSKTAQAARAIRRQRSWALTGTPIENRPEDLINLFAFIKPDPVPPETPVKKLPDLTHGFLLRRVKEDVIVDMPPKLVRDAYVELTPEQRARYELAETEGVVHLNNLGDTITIQHVFELVLRLKQICNFDPLTGQSGKLDQLQADLAEVAASGRKAILFSQWVEPLEILAGRLAEFGPLQFHGRVPSRARPAVLERFRDDPDCHLLLMSYGTGSVGLNLQFANYVFLFDRWWNPAVEDQAINRAHRIGQKDPVLVTRFVTPGTIESRICAVLERKRQLFAELIGDGVTPSLGMSEEEVFGLFDLTARPHRQESATVRTQVQPRPPAVRVGGLAA